MAFLKATATKHFAIFPCATAALLATNIALATPISPVLAAQRLQVDQHRAVVRCRHLNQNPGEAVKVERFVPRENGTGAENHDLSQHKQNQEGK